MRYSIQGRACRDSAISVTRGLQRRLWIQKTPQVAERYGMETTPHHTHFKKQTLVNQLSNPGESPSRQTVPSKAIHLKRSPRWRERPEGYQKGLELRPPSPRAYINGNRPRNPIYRSGGIGARVHAWKRGHSATRPADASGHYA